MLSAETMKGTAAPELSGRVYREMFINSRDLEIPRNKYQRRFRSELAEKIAKDFDERIANEPKVSQRDGRYFVFDGQHTIAAREARNGGKPLPILCKVYMGLTEKEEALLFARQFGFSSRLTPGEELRAMDVGGDLIGTGFVRATKSAGFDIDYTQQSARRRLGCVATAFKEYQKVGERMYIDALRILADAWDGDPESLRSETVTAMCRFVELYDEEYDRERLVRRLKKEDPIAIYRNGRDMGNAMAGYKKYLFQVLRIYNGCSQKQALPIKF